MSGGAFDYRQYHIEEIADDIERAIIEAGREIPKEVYNRWYGRSSDDSDRIYPTYDRKTIDIMKRAVYPNWINDFWRIMGLIHFGDKLHFCVPGEKRFDEAAIRQFCTEAGLAFYDTATEVRRLRDNASDAFLEVVTPTDIPALLARIPKCRTLVTTGEKASQIVADSFRCPVPPVGGYVDIVMPGFDRESLRFWRMPSTSRAYPLPLEKKAEAYRQLF